MRHAFRLSATLGAAAWSFVALCAVAAAEDVDVGRTPPSIPIVILPTPQQSAETASRNAAADERDGKALEAQIKAAAAGDRAADIAERMLWPSWVQMAASLVIIAVTIGFNLRSLGQTRRALDHAKESADAARASAKAAAEANEMTVKLSMIDRRAWIRIDMRPAEELQVFDSGFYTQVSVDLKNVGNSVASGVRVFIRPFMYESAENNFKEEAIAWLYDRMRYRPRFDESPVVFPGEVLTARPDLALNEVELKAFGIAIPVRGIVRIVALAEYYTEGFSEPRRTLTHFDLASQSLDGKGRILIFADGNLPPEKLFFTKSGTGSAT